MTPRNFFNQNFLLFQFQIDFFENRMEVKHGCELRKIEANSKKSQNII